METIGIINETEEIVFEWSIPNFLSLSEERGVSYFSPLFFFHKAFWCIELYPNGVKKYKSNRCMCVCLHRKTSGPPIDIEKFFGMKGAKGYILLSGYSRYIFNKVEHDCTISWFARDYPLEKKLEYLPSDTLTLLCCIKHPQSMEFSDNPLQTNSENIRFLSKSHLARSNLESIGKINGREEFVIEWFIGDLYSLSVQGGVSYFSPYFSFGNISWCIEVFRRLDKKRKSDEYTHVYLHKKSSGPPIRMEYTFGYRVALFNYSTDYMTCVFNDKDLLSRTAFLIKKSDLNSNLLTLVCRIKRPQITDCSGKEVTTKSSINFHLNKVFQDFKELFLKQKDCDVVLKVRGQEFPAHKYILAARSPVFESTFRNDMKEKQTGIVDIEDCDPSSFSDFLSFLYCGEIDTLSKENVFSLFTTADKYDVQDLREICIEFMKKHISVDTFCDIITLAVQYSETELIRMATDFFTMNSLKIVNTVPWQKFAAENPTQSNELLIKAFEDTTCSNIDSFF